MPERNYELRVRLPNGEVVPVPMVGPSRRCSDFSGADRFNREVLERAREVSGERYPNYSLHDVPDSGESQ